jgi:hypothetical protein
MAAIATLPAGRLAELLSFARAVKTTVWVPTPSVPDQVNVTPFPQEPPGFRLISWATPPTTTATLSARAPEAFS